MHWHEWNRTTTQHGVERRCLRCGMEPTGDEIPEGIAICRSCGDWDYYDDSHDRYVLMRDHRHPAEPMTFLFWPFSHSAIAEMVEEQRKSIEG